MKDERARAVIIHKHKILLIQRVKAESVYYVLPGGHVEENESPESAVLREIKEETSLEVAFNKKLTTLFDKDTTVHHLYLCEYISGTPRLTDTSPELTKESGENIYTPLWIEIDKLKDLPMWPAEVKPFLLNYLKG